MKRFWTIRMRFIVFGLLSVVPLLGFNWLLVSNHNDTRTQDLVAYQTALSNQVSSATTGYLNNSYRALEGLSTNQVLVEGTDREAISGILGQARSVRPDYVGVFMLNQNGEVVAQTGAVESSILPSINGQVDGVLATGQRAISGRIDLPLDPPTSVFVMLVPISPVVDPTTSPEGTPPASTSTGGDQEDEAPGTIRGVIGVVINTEFVAQTVLPQSRSGSDVIIFADQKIMASTGDLRANEKPFMDNLNTQNPSLSETGTDVFRMTSINGNERSVVWIPLPLDSSGWSVMIISPVPESQLGTLWEQLLALTLVAALVYLVISFAFGELISRSLNDLTESARRLAEGDYKTPIAKRGSGEMSELRDSLIDLRRSTEVIMSDVDERQGERQRQNEQLRDLLRRDSRLQEDERRHIASEIHDAVSPLITGALYQSRALQRANGGATTHDVQTSLGDVNELLERASQELHGIIFDLRPPDLDDIGVVAAIEAFVSTIQRTGLETRLEVIDDPPPLSPEVRLGIYRIVQEALHNVLRHASADEAVVRMEYVNQLLRVTIRDNGAGFDPEGPRRPTSLGLLSMRERAAAIDADFEILSRPGGGTVIIVERRDTGSVMSNELLDSILRDRAHAEVEDIHDLPDNNDVDTDSSAEASR